MKKTTIVIATALLAGCSIYSKLDYEVRPSGHSGVALICKESTSGACQFVVVPPDGGHRVASRYDVPSGHRRELDGMPAGTRVCAVVRRGATCTPQDVAVGR